MTLSLTVLMGCDPLEEAGGGTQEAGVTDGGGTDGGGTGGGCGQAGEKMRHWLPTFGSLPDEATIESVAVNPCLPMSGLVDVIGTFVPDTDEVTGSRAAVKEFAGRVVHMAGYYSTVADTTKCLYEADALSIGIYQHSDHPWSVGLVVAVGRDFEAGIKAVSCYLTGQSVLSDRPPAAVPDTDIAVQVCADPVLPKEDPVVVLRFGTSNWMCSALDRAVPRA